MTETRRRWRKLTLQKWLLVAWFPIATFIVITAAALGIYDIHTAALLLFITYGLTAVCLELIRLELKRIDRECGE